ncbi:hypothetical protein BJY01DRAFT_210892 [Aspergillus pseudoustus]|uniref:NADH-ubiquinone oxidoreductase 9.5 kDa subunit n=1 Tax=Aspergillus pseudoustus TaxID=1810923 RepID=A0ABR4KAA5_9EURO
MTTPQFWSTPLRYLRWASHEKPAIFYSLVIGATGPVMLVSLPPIRRFFGDVDPEPIPLTYPSKYRRLIQPILRSMLYVVFSSLHDWGIRPANNYFPP